uniref:Uncharacterized protein n=1 Tax=viral metagenome TaxID=1070528 RepID=A0A6H1ZD67_9ZZZZ
MKYKIFELVGKVRYEPALYGISAVMSYKLENAEEYLDYDTVEKAEQHIEENKQKYQGSELIILPVYSVKFKG